MKNGIAIAGNLIVDHVKLIDTYPAQGMLCNIRSRSKCVGGCAANTLAGLAIMDPALPLYCLGSIGGDDDGKYILDRLERWRINTDGVLVKPDVITSFTDVMAVDSTGERTFFHARGANAKFGFDNLDFEIIKKAGVFHMGYALLLDEFDKPDEEYGTVMAKVLCQVQKLGIKTSIDVVSEEGERFAQVVKPSLKYCDYFIANEIESGRVAGLEARDGNGRLNPASLRQICEKLFEFGVKALTVVHAPEGGAAMTADGQFCFVPSLVLPEGYIKGSVGAGDAFCAGVLYGIYKEKSVEETIRIGNAAAAANLSEADSVSGLRAYDEIMKLVKLYGKSDA